MIAPRVGTRLHSDEAVIALLICDGPARPGEIRIERRRMLVDIVHIAAASVRLPDFHQGIGNRALVFIEYMAVHNDALAQRLALVLLGEICIALLHRVVAVDRPGQLGERLRNDDQRLRRRALHRAAVAGREMLGKSAQTLFWENQCHSCSFSLAPSGYSFDCKRHTLSTPDAHGGKPKLAPALLKTVSRRHRQTSARHAEWMTERDRAAVRIDEVGIIGKPKLSQAG